MKKLIWKTALFCCLLLLLLVPVELLVRNIPNPYSQKLSYLERNAGEIQTLVLGSSHAFFGIDTDSMPRYTLNLANVSQSLDFDEWLLGKYIDALPELKNVVVEVSYFSLAGKLSLTVEEWRRKNYRIYFNQADVFPLRYDFEVAYNFRSCLNRIVSYYILGRKPETCSPSGFGTDYVIGNRPLAWKDSGPVAAKRHTFRNAGTEQENAAHLRQILVLCKQHSIRPILLMPPAWETYAGSLNPAQLASVVGTCEALKQEFAVPFLNLLEDKRFTEGDFFDADHLCADGARKLASIISGQLL